MRAIEKSNFPAQKAASLARGRWLAGPVLYIMPLPALLLVGVLFTAAATWAALGLVLLLLALFAAAAHDTLGAIPPTLAAGLAGEAILRRVLGELGDEYTVFFGLIAPGHLEIDALVVGPCGLVALEAKHYAGVILHEPAGWRRIAIDSAGVPQPRRIGDPSAQVLRATHALARHLLTGGLVCRPHAAVVFTEPRAVLEIDAAPVTILRPADVVAYIEHLRGTDTPVMTEAYVTALDALPAAKAREHRT